MLYTLLALTLAALFSKEYMLINDNLVIIIVFAVIFAYIISVASPVIENHIEDVRLNIIKEIAFNVNKNIVMIKNHFETLKKQLEFLYHLDMYVEDHYDLVISEVEEE